MYLSARLRVFIVFVLSLNTAQLAFAMESSHAPYQNSLTTLNPEFMLDTSQVQKWHKNKNKFGATYSGSRAWQAYVKYLEKQLKRFNVLDIKTNKWSYDRWHTTGKQNKPAWQLTSDGVDIAVSHYGAYSGATDEVGITANLAVYQPGMPVEQMAGKVMVFATLPHPNPPLSEQYKKWFTFNDYEYLAENADIPELFTVVPTETTVAYDTWWQLQQTLTVTNILKQSQAAGAIIVFNMGPERLAGLYTFPVMPVINVPTLYVDRTQGQKLMVDAKAGKSATLRLSATTSASETYQLIGYLPGKHYGSGDDERILLTTHTDGPNLQQENGALGLLAIIAYFSHIPQQHRPRTLMVYLDNRHYMPGLEAAFAQHDWFVKNPAEKDQVVGLIATEHLGQLEFREAGNDYGPTGKEEVSLLWVRNEQALIDKAIQAVQDHQWPRVLVQAVERPGINGGPQGVWYGLGSIALQWNIPAYATMGIQGGYWTTTADITRFDAELFLKQVAAMTQLTGELMRWVP